MKQLTFEELLESGCHFGHLKRKWNPNMSPYIFMERKGIHVIDLYKTIAMLEEATKAIKQIVLSNRKILFVGTKKQAKELIAEAGKKMKMPYVVERWPGGLLTNFGTIHKSIKKMSNIDNMMGTQSYANMSKREKLQISRERAKLEKNLGSIADMNRIPSALFVVDINKEHIAVDEAGKLNIPVFAIVDTNSNPLLVDFPIPANDDAAKSIGIIVNYITDAVLEALSQVRQEKEFQHIEQENVSEEKKQTFTYENEPVRDNKDEEKLVKKTIKISMDEEEHETESTSTKKQQKKLLRNK